MPSLQSVLKNQFTHIILLLLVLLGSCRSKQYSIAQTQTTNTRILATDSVLQPDSSILSIIAPYKAKLDSQMNEVIGHAEVPLINTRPNGTLGNYIADVLKDETSKLIGKDVDFAFTNISGIRMPSLPQGDITKRNLFELLPFDNMVIAAKVNGETFKKVLEKIAAKGGEAISGFKMVISTEGKLLTANYNSTPIDFSKEYILCTNDFLFNGGDGYTMLGENVLETYTVSIPIRNMIMEHIQKLWKTDVPLNPKADERITIQ